MSDVKLFKLVTGEEFVGKIADRSSGTVFIENPCLLALTVGAGGKPGLNMQPMLMFSEDKTVTIKQEHIIYVVGVDINIQNKYNEIFGTGIVVAKTPLIV
jgi:hypothetical protein